jgi:hypothetical protein
MPGLTLSTQANIAYKNLSGKSLTYVENALVGETIGIFFNVTSDNIWLNKISASRSEAILSGYAIKVTASLVYIADSNNKAWQAYWPITAPSGTDPITNTTYTYNSGVLTGITGNSPLRNSISEAYGVEYRCLTYDNSGNEIVPLDSRNWLFQYNSGVWFQEIATVPSPTAASLYTYVGPTLETEPTTPFTNASFSEVSLGGLNNRTTFDSVNINSFLNSVLYPSQQANITSFSILNVATSYELGDGPNFTQGPFTFSWTVNNTASAVADNVYITGWTGSVIYGPTSNNGTISGYTISSGVHTYASPSSSIWYLSALRTNGERISSSFSINWYYGLYYGATTGPGLTTSFNTVLSVALDDSPFGSYTLPYGGEPSYKYIVVPDSFATLSLVSWKGLPVSMADSTDGYTFSANDLSYNLVSYQNIHNNSFYNYKVYRTKNMIGTTMSNVIVS